MPRDHIWKLTLEVESADSVSPSCPTRFVRLTPVLPCYYGRSRFFHRRAIHPALSMHLKIHHRPCLPAADPNDHRSTRTLTVTVTQRTNHKGGEEMKWIRTGSWRGRPSWHQRAGAGGSCGCPCCGTRPCSSCRRCGRGCRCRQTWTPRCTQWYPQARRRGAARCRPRGWLCTCDACVCAMRSAVEKTSRGALASAVPAKSLH